MDTEFLRVGRWGVVRLNRPQVLNALGPAQFPEILDVLRRWNDDDDVQAVLLEGAGDRAFCAGGDIKAVWENRQRGADDDSRTLFRTEYTLDRHIHRYGKPVVSLLHGIVMGGGAGLSLNGRFQVVTDNTVFAMPEAVLGFFPDVGASHFLNRAPGRLGLYLGLTGARLGAADMVAAGLASHHVPLEHFPRLRQALADSSRPVAEILDEFHQPPGRGVYHDRLELIDACFGGASVGEILAALEARPEEWLQQARALMLAESPLSLAVIHRQLTGARGMDFEAAIAREYRMACAFLEGDGFIEGIRAALVDKDRKPRWHPANLDRITEEEVERHFRPLRDELVFDAEGKT